ncbi:MAG: AAA family ATPase [Acutalibacteraceae bacterium]|nr:AAA family ATPase [Acutalibacteraceae bacterium]
MYIKSIHLNSFKSYEDTKIHFNSKFNVLIGENNVGKTTIFEAIQLWNKCFDISITSNGKDFYSSSSPLYISFEQLYFLRLTKDTDIFFNNKRSCEIIITFSIDTECFSLGFRLTRPQIANAYIRISQIDPAEFENLKDCLIRKNIKLHDFIFIQQTAPVANVLSKEPYMFEGQITKKIQRGKSNEVLRNKILKCLETDTHLINLMKDVLDKDFEFIIPKRKSRSKDEYIDLYVQFNGSKKQEVYLQGSGFLQTAEIFSTIKIMDNALNITLIDEPDSHISPRIQSKLLKHIQEINNTQIFVISHNDNFVETLEPENIIFINEENKASNEIRPLDEINLDYLHTSLGGIISGLTRLQRSKKVVFVEGNDDIEYIKQLNQAIKRTTPDKSIDLNQISFWYIRGKDYIAQKIMTGKQLLSQAVSSCEFSAIFDKDFSTILENEKYKRNTISKRLGSDLIHTHDGYCIESVLFSNRDLLKTYLTKLLPSEFDLDLFIDNYFSQISNDIANTASNLYVTMKSKFKTQKRDARPELKDVELDDFSREARDNIQFAMLKDNIKHFVIKLETEANVKLFSRTDDSSETISSTLLEKYFETLNAYEEIYPSYIELIDMLQRFIIN